MPRDPAGTYTLPALGNPAVTNTPITIAWWNGTGTDLATALTNSFDRTGATGGMTGPFKAVDGTAGAPGITFTSESTTGFYRPTAGEFDVVVGGTRLSRWTAAGFQESFDSGATWKNPLYNNNGNQTFVGGLEFSSNALTVGGVPVSGHPAVVAKSSSCGAFSTTSTSYVAITNLSVSFTSNGGPVFVQLVSDDSVNPALLQAANTNTSNLSVAADIALSTDNGATFFSIQQFGNFSTNLVGSTNAAFTTVWPVTSYSAWCVVTPGAATIKAYIKSVATAGTTTAIVSYAKLCVVTI